MKIVPKDRVIAYHCPCCGGTCDPEKGICDYCAQALTDRFSVVSGFRVKFGDKYFKDVLRVWNISTEQDTIETSTLENEQRRYIHGLFDPAILTIDFRLTSHLRRQMDFLDKDYHTLAIEFLSDDAKHDQSFEIECRYAWDSLSDISFFDDATVTMRFVIENYIGLTHIKIPENMNCKNCGAPITSRYGCCPYCGGWVQWIPGGMMQLTRNVKMP